MTTVTIPPMLASKKFIATILGLALTIFAPQLELTEEQQLQIAGVVAAYVVGQGLADHGKEAEKERKKQ